MKSRSPQVHPRAHNNYDIAKHDSCHSPQDFAKNRFTLRSIRRILQGLISDTKFITWVNDDSDGIHLQFFPILIKIKKAKKTKTTVIIALSISMMTNHPGKNSRHDSRRCRHLVYQLKIIASLKKNDRINTTNGLYIQNSVFQSVQRWYTGENRSVNLSTLESIFDEALEYYEHLLQQIEAMEEDSKRNKQCKLKQQAESLKFELEQSLTGLSNLAFTYKAHADVVAKIYTLSKHVSFQL